MSSAPDHIYLDLSVVNNDNQGSKNKNVLQFSENRTNPILYNPSNYEMSVVRFEVDTPASTLPIFIPLLNVDGVNNDINQTAYTVTMAQINEAGTALTNLKTANVVWSPEDVSAALPSNQTASIPSPSNYIVSQAVSPGTYNFIFKSGGFSAKDLNASVLPAAQITLFIQNAKYTTALTPNLSLTIYNLTPPVSGPFTLPFDLTGFYLQLSTSVDPQGLPLNTSILITSVSTGLDIVLGYYAQFNLAPTSGATAGTFTDTVSFAGTNTTFYKPNTVVTSIQDANTALISPSYTSTIFPLQITYSAPSPYYSNPTTIVTGTSITTPLQTTTPLAIASTIGVNQTYYSNFKQVTYSVQDNPNVLVISGLTGDLSSINFKTVFTSTSGLGLPANTRINIISSQITVNGAYTDIRLSLDNAISVTYGINYVGTLQFLVSAPVFSPYTTVLTSTSVGGFYNQTFSLPYKWIAPTSQISTSATFDGATVGFPTVTGYSYTASSSASNYYLIQNNFTLQDKPALASQDITTGYYSCYNCKWWLSCVNSALNDVWTQFAGNTLLNTPNIVIDKTTNLITLLTPIQQNSGTPPSYSYNFAVSNLNQTNAATPLYLSEGSSPSVQYVLFFNEPLFNLFSGFPSVYYGDKLSTQTGVFDNPTDTAILSARPYLLEYFIQPVNYQNVNIVTLRDINNESRLWVTTNSEYSPVPMWNPIMSIQFTSNLLPNLLSYTTARVPYNDIQNNGLVSSGNNSQITDMITDIQVALVSGSEYKPSVLYIPKGQYRLIDLQGSQPIHNVDFKVSWKTKYGQVIPFRLGAQCGANLKILFRRKRFDLLNLPPYDTN